MSGIDLTEATRGVLTKMAKYNPSSLYSKDPGCVCGVNRKKLPEPELSTKQKALLDFRHYFPPFNDFLQDLRLPEDEDFVEVINAIVIRWLYNIQRARKEELLKDLPDSIRGHYFLLKDIWGEKELETKEQSIINTLCTFARPEWLEELAHDTMMEIHRTNYAILPMTMKDFNTIYFNPATHEDIEITRDLAKQMYCDLRDY